MQSSAFQITTRQDTAVTRAATIADAFETSDLSRETWLFVSPHDDDLCLGAGLFMQQAVAEGVNVQVLVVTDGRMGYCTLEQRESISDIRRKETYESFAILGVVRESIAWINYPDGGLYPLQEIGRAHV